mmetsp:Transcript_20079/g.27256  ORF Transcript_20079/g.27256 Transcript_20079/m.27256 type:complete len:454 (-) Transcript_20079:195-1556(-)|eukprot:CAMPEP_0185769248 /NCGR_PEP_ID=MMETSP1174-20130828/53469_1 /TAXON_ID=35687 /ORGANISM="Dictyocha speculum, Strain CCMP1381" /LENGTH=453 /DNA_ID=CAMNT_0028454241 /DNA_START=154 /DNA_END=1515 /DNA_ORIENTATION=-
MEACGNSSRISPEVSQPLLYGYSSEVKGFDGYWLPIEQWIERYEKTRAPPKPKTQEEEKKIGKREQKQTEWLIDTIANSMVDALFVAIPEISSAIMSEISDAAKVQATQVAEDEARFCERIARLTNALAAMDATVRFEETARRKRKATCCNPFAPCCSRYPKPSKFEALRVEAAADVKTAVQELLPGKAGGFTYSKVEEVENVMQEMRSAAAVNVLDAFTHIATKIVALLDEASNSSGAVADELDKLASAIGRAASTSAGRGAGRVLAESIRGKLRAQVASLASNNGDSAVASAVTDAFGQLADVINKDEEAGRVMGEIMAEALKTALRQALRAQVVSVLAAAVSFGDGALADAAVMAINAKLALDSVHATLADGTSADIEELKEMERTTAAAAEEATALFAKISQEVESLDAMGVEEIKQAHDAATSRFFSQLVKAKEEAIAELKAYVASRQ